jgi:hypothetical protein
MTDVDPKARSFESDRPLTIAAIACSRTFGKVLHDSVRHQELGILRPVISANRRLNVDARRARSSRRAENDTAGHERHSGAALRDGDGNGTPTG